MNVSLLIVTYRRDFPYLKYCLRSIATFADGFDPVLVVPNQHFDEAVALTRENCFNCRVSSGEEWEGKGFLWHEAQIVRADEWCPKADLIAHMDADCIFTEKCTPDAYMHDGKPVMIYASYDWLFKQQANLMNWKVAAQNALGFEVENEFMRRHPSIHIPEAYKKTREMIEDHHRKPLDEYIKEQKNTFPQTFAEFPTIGAVAWKFFNEKYQWINQETEPWPHNPMRQAWSHREPTAEDMAEFRRLGIA